MEWLNKIGDVPAPLFALWFVTTGSIIVALSKYVVKLHKEQKELLNTILPILAIIKDRLG